MFSNAQSRSWLEFKANCICFTDLQFISAQQVVMTP